MIEHSTECDIMNLDTLQWRSGRLRSTRSLVTKRDILKNDYCYCDHPAGLRWSEGPDRKPYMKGEGTDILAEAEKANRAIGSGRAGYTGSGNSSFV